MLLVGLTGGLGAGKSTVGGMLSDRGAVLVDADELAREALDPGTAAYKQVCDLFGDQVVTASGQLDREAIAAAVFDEPERRRTLESIVHPEVFRMLADIVEDRRGTEDIIVFDAPLIVETGFHDACDVVVVVTAQEEARVARAVGGRGMTVDEARARIRAQLADADREAVADVVIRNDGTLADLERQVDELWEQLRARGD
ncbi:MAG TPA: dephospho-CoA kinase [Actinomycetota bacterium]|nr:dephospho-CoA kinase [Actinomycetota bacterium]